jgi:thiol-disulfide isomerase/thioredoxin
MLDKRYPTSAHCGFVAMSVLIAAVAMGAQKDPAPSRLIEGQVYDYAGAGILDVDVLLFAKTDKDLTDPIATSRSRAYGDFSIPRGDRDVPTQAVVVFRKTGYTEVRHEVELPADALPVWVDVELPGGLTLRGMVTDKVSHKPVAGALVRVSAQGRDWEAETGEDGAFEVGGLLDHPVRVTVEADGFGRERVNLRSIPQGEPLKIELEAGRVLRLVVMDWRGDPISGVVVDLVDPVGGSSWVVETDDDGRGELRGLSRSVAVLRARLAHPKYVSDTGFPREIKIGTTANESEHRFTLLSAGAIEGRVTAAGEEGGSLQGARLTIGPGTGGDSPRDWTGFDGKYAIAGIAPGPTVLTCYRSGYAPQLREIKVEAGQTHTIDFVLNESQEAGGIVVDAKGSPVAGAYVYATLWLGYETLGVQVLTDEEGKFSLWNIPDEKFSVTIQGVGFNQLVDQEITPGKTDHRFELQPRAARQAPANALVVGKPFPALEFVTMAGDNLTMADLKGKWVFVDFWATWCGPCLIEIPHIVELQNSMRKRSDFAILSITLDDDGSERQVRSAVKKHKMNWPHVFGTKNGATKAADKCGVQSIPAAFLVGPDGLIKAVNMRGPSLKDDVARIMKAAENSDK